ncbi:hypothetical protein Csa_012206 [Cucumis sativus]|uniref:Uncharacterized protein n=1 Tax=Cucumis sativus TaxID=3659 RepID=A0A0A0KYR8_CUCSA|nr:hypothetical protein Csa_012206 [Cucumis sativus]
MRQKPSQTPLHQMSGRAMRGSWYLVGVALSLEKETPWASAGRKRYRPNRRSQRRNSPVWPSRGEDEWQEESVGGQKMALA